MKAVWLEGAKDKAARRQEVLNYRNAFDDLTSLLQRKYKRKDAVRNYENPNWMAEQISVNEYNAVLEDILKLITLTKD